MVFVAAAIPKSGVFSFLSTSVAWCLEELVYGAPFTAGIRLRLVIPVPRGVWADSLVTFTGIKVSELRSMVKDGFLWNFPFVVWQLVSFFRAMLLSGPAVIGSEFYPAPLSTTFAPMAPFTGLLF